MSIDHLLSLSPVRARMLAANQVVSSTDPCRPLAYLKHFSLMYKDLWSGVDQMRAHGRTRLPDWPEWCFMSSALAYGLLAGKKNNLPGWQSTHPPIIAAISGWRTSQGIYRFHPMVFESLCQTPLEGDIPTEVLLRLPEWCVYIETPDLISLFNKRLYGFFACLDWCATTGRPSLHLLIDDEIGLAPVKLELVGSLGESLRSVLKETLRERRCDHPVILSGMVENAAQRLAPLISLVLYLCSVNAELRDSLTGEERPARPAPVATKKGVRFFPPDRPATWEVAFRFGAALQTAYRTEQAAPQGGAHARKRPHVRRFHWHAYWVGPKSHPEERRVILKWLSPIRVNATKVEDLVPVIRPVNPMPRVRQ